MQDHGVNIKYKLVTYPTNTGHSLSRLCTNLLFLTTLVDVLNLNPDVIVEIGANVNQNVKLLKHHLRSDQTYVAIQKSCDFKHIDLKGKYLRVKTEDLEYEITQAFGGDCYSFLLDFPLDIYVYNKENLKHYLILLGTKEG